MTEAKKISHLCSAVLLATCTSLITGSAAQLNVEQEVSDTEYVTFLRTNLARYIAVSRRQAYCPANTSLLHGELLQACADNPASIDQTTSEESSQEALQNYTSISLKYKQWFKPLVVTSSSSESRTTSCHDSTQETTQAECVLNRLVEVPLDDFWPFNLEVIKKNQMLTMLSASDEMVDSEDRALKQMYFETLESIQNVSLPFHPEEILLSFRDGGLVKTLTDFQFPGNPVEYLYGGKHLFNRTEQTHIEDLTHRALQLITQVDSQLHQSMLQALGVFAFYRSHEQLYLGGSNGKLVGLVWLEPTNWSLLHMSEELVHEFIHNALFQAEIVHGLMREDKMRKTVKSWSSIRAARRPYDKALHAAFVSTGLIHFHSKVYDKFPDMRDEIRAKVTKLLNTFDKAIKELRKNNEKYQVLNGPGAAILNHMTDMATRASIL